MTIDFKDEEIIAKERFSKLPYVGYFTPMGELLDFNLLLGGHNHEDPINPLSFDYLDFVSYIIQDTNVYDLGSEELINNTKYNGIKECVRRGYDENNIYNTETYEEFLEKLNKRYDKLDRIKGCDDYHMFEYKLLKFFINAYKNNDFFRTIDRKIFVQNPNIVKKNLQGKSYEYHLKKELLYNLKDICIQYLGYDSLERFTASSNLIEVPKIGYDKSEYVITPRVITTSVSNIYDRFYNYILMNWTIRKVPRYRYNENTLCYEIMYNIESEHEQELKNELGSIKRFVPLNQRYKYFK